MMSLFVHIPGDVDLCVVGWPDLVSGRLLCRAHFLYFFAMHSGTGVRVSSNEEPL
jgi:hypothetical protein